MSLLLHCALERVIKEVLAWMLETVNNVGDYLIM